MTAAAVAANLQALDYNTPRAVEQFTTRILTQKGTVASPAGGCGVGCSDMGTMFNLVGDIVCSEGFSTPATINQVNDILLVRGSRTDNLNY